MLTGKLNKLFTFYLIRVMAIGAVFSGCTEQLPDSFRFFQQQQAFSVTKTFNNKVDLLLVVDNSASMDSAQDKLRSGLPPFIDKIANSPLDVRIAAISTDAYMANSAFSNYLNTVVPGSVGYNSSHISAKIAAMTYSNPSWAPNLVNMSTGDFDSGFTYNALNPIWGPSAARLVTGVADGPRTGMCFEPNRIFLDGNSDCAVRDNYPSTGPDSCISPGGGETAISQCVNTVQNDTVRSGKAIVETMPPVGVPKDATWIQGLKDDFMVNATTGTAGQGSERGFASILQLIADNEPSATTFFRSDALRVIMFISDEDDDSTQIPASPPAGFTPQSYWKCDEASLVSLNPSKNINGVNGYCCSNPANNCTYGALGTSCSAKTVESYTYTISTCPDESQLIPVSEFKGELDSFFQTLDGTGSSGDPNYLVAVITPLTAATIQSLQADRDAVDNSIGRRLSIAVDRGDRYLDLMNQVGNGSTSLDIGVGSYAPFMDALTDTITQKVATFYTALPISQNKNELIVEIIHADQSRTRLQNEQFEVNYNEIRITDLEFVLSLDPSDQFFIDYQPSSNTL